MVELLSLTLSIYGLAALVAFFVAALIALIVRVQQARLPSATPVTPVPAAPMTVPPQQELIPAHHLAAISAALATVLDTHRIVHVRTLHGRGWNVEGRAQHHTSHNVPHRPHR